MYNFLPDLEHNWLKKMRRFNSAAWSPSSFQQNGYNWANFSLSSIFYNNGVIKGKYTIDDYVKSGVRVSVYNVDTYDNRIWYISNMDKLYAITTNYPKLLLEAIGSNWTALLKS